MLEGEQVAEESVATATDNRGRLRKRRSGRRKAMVCVR
jgi:hypothetical protein